jgi:hypothetical protein
LLVSPRGDHDAWLARRLLAERTRDHRMANLFADHPEPRAEHINAHAKCNRVSRMRPKWLHGMVVEQLLSLPTLGPRRALSIKRGNRRTALAR